MEIFFNGISFFGLFELRTASITVLSSAFSVLVDPSSLMKTDPLFSMQPFT